MVATTIEIQVTKQLKVSGFSSSQNIYVVQQRARNARGMIFLGSIVSHSFPINGRMKTQTAAEATMILI